MNVFTYSGMTDFRTIGNEVFGWLTSVMFYLLICTATDTARTLSVGQSCLKTTRSFSNAWKEFERQRLSKPLHIDQPQLKNSPLEITLLIVKPLEMSLQPATSGVSNLALSSTLAALDFYSWLIIKHCSETLFVVYLFTINDTVNVKSVRFLCSRRSLI